MEVIDAIESHRHFLEVQGLTEDPEIPGVMDESELYDYYVEALMAAREDAGEGEDGPAQSWHMCGTDVLRA